MGEDDLMVDRERAEDVRRLAVGEGVEAMSQRLPVDCNEPGRGSGTGSIEPLGVATEGLLQFGRIEPLQNAAYRGVGWRPPQRGVGEGGIEEREPSLFRPAPRR